VTSELHRRRSVCCFVENTPSRAFLFAAAAGVLGRGARRAAQGRRSRASPQHYQGRSSRSFEGWHKEQALVEFQTRQELVPKKANPVHDSRQSSTTLGLLRARANYQEFYGAADERGTGRHARPAIEAINTPGGVLRINTVPESGTGSHRRWRQVFTGEAPTSFGVPRGRYRVTSANPNSSGRTRHHLIRGRGQAPVFK